MALVYSHFSDVPSGAAEVAAGEGAWRTRWPHFTPRELACPHCGALRVEPAALDRMEAVRQRYGAALPLASAYRCPAHPIEAAKIEAARARGDAEYDGGAHTRGAAFDPDVARIGDLAALEDAFFAEAPLGRGKGQSGGVRHLHFDWDEALGRRSWFYGS